MAQTVASGESKIVLYILSNAPQNASNSALAGAGEIAFRSSPAQNARSPLVSTTPFVSGSVLRDSKVSPLVHV